MEEYNPESIEQEERDYIEDTVRASERLVEFEMRLRERLAAEGLVWDRYYR